MTSPRPLAGTVPMLATPFGADGGIDEQALRRVARHVIASGAAGLAVGGLASEAHTLSLDERMLVAEVVAEEVAGRVALLVTATAESTILGVKLARHAVSCGADAVMLAPPSVTKATPDALELHYRTIAEQAGAPLMIQEAPAFVSTSLGFDRIAKLVDACPNILYLKIEAVPLPRAVAEAKTRLDGSVRIFSGSGGLEPLDAYAAGAEGSIPGCDVPEVFVAIDTALQTGDRVTAERLYRAALPFLEAENHSLDMLIAASKHVLAERGVIRCTDMRKPGGVNQSELEPVMEAYRALRRDAPGIFETVDSGSLEHQRKVPSR